MHSIGIRMRCTNATKLPFFINQARVFMASTEHIECEDTKGKHFFSNLHISDECTAWVIANDI